MKLITKGLLLLLLLFGAEYIHSQELDKVDEIFIDSLKKTTNTILIIHEYCIGCGKVDGKLSATNNNDKICAYNDEYLIAWFNRNNDSIKIRMANYCAFLLSEHLKSNFPVTKFEKLFIQVFKDSSEKDTWIKSNNSDSTNYPITGSTFYRISKYNDTVNYSIYFHENILNIDTELENLLNDILVKFNDEKNRLLKEGIKNEKNWH